MSLTAPPIRELNERVRDHLKRHDMAGLRAILETVPAPDVGEALDRLSVPEQRAAFEQMASGPAAHALAETDRDTKRSILEPLDRERLADLLRELPRDDLTRLVNDVPRRADELLDLMEPDDADEVRSSLRYPARSAGRLMTDQFPRLASTLTAGEALDHLRRMHRKCETVTDLYVIAEEDRLLGVLSLRALILAPPEQPIREIMTTEVVSAAPTDDQEIAARLVAHYNFLALPVVRDGRILGIITVDDIIDVLAQEDTEDQLRLGAIEPGVIDQPYFSTPIWRVVRSRVGWLVLLFVAETATGSVLRYFDKEFAKVVALTFFIPLLIGTGGNTGAQTVSTIIRGLALKEIRLKDTGRVVLRELGSGLLLGLLLGGIAFGRALLWHSGLQLSIVVGLTIVAICTWANTIGSLIPLLAQRLRVDPALVSAPLITTLVDATGLAIYLLIARAILTALK